MKYTTEITIDLPRARVIELFDNEENIYKWQPGLQSFETIEGKHGEVGAVARLKYKMGKRSIEMTETILKKDFPERFDCLYQAKGVKNWMQNEFTEADAGTTRWITHNEFKCKGMAKLFMWISPGAFRKQTAKMMNDFKSFAEHA